LEKRSWQLAKSSWQLQREVGNWQKAVGNLKRAVGNCKKQWARGIWESQEVVGNQKFARITSFLF
jgi:hypothetical protein